MGDKPEEVASQGKTEIPAAIPTASIENDEVEVNNETVKMEEGDQTGEPDEDIAGEPEDEHMAEEPEDEEMKDETADSTEVKEENEEGEKVDPAVVEGKQDESEKRQPIKVHPYKHLVDNFEIPLLCKMRISKYKVKPMDKMPCIFVSTKTYLEELSEQLMLEKEIGVAVKYNYQTYKTRLCVLLISTRRANYIIDSIKLQKSLRLLGEVFINPNVVKIMYSSLKILRNLQLENNLWFVNIFDVQLAMKRLGLKESYKEYIERRFNVKRYNEAELSKWHFRPLHEDHRINAIITMHCLIPTFFDLKNKLLDAKPESLMEPVMMECNKRCGYIFQPIRTLDDMYPNLQYLPPNQVAALHALNEWRHKVAKKGKKNVNFVLSKMQMTKLSTATSLKAVDILRIADSPQVRSAVAYIKTLLNINRKVIGPVNSRFGTGGSIAKATGGNSSDAKDGNKSEIRSENEKKKKQRSKRMNFAQKKAQFGKIQPQKRIPDRNFGPRFDGPRRGDGFNRPGGRTPSRFHPHAPRGDFRSPPRHRSTPRPRSPPGPMRSRSPPSYIIVARNGETLEVNNSNVLDRYFNNDPSRDFFERDRSPHRNTSVWEKDRNTNRGDALDSINTLINLSSSLMKLSRQANFNESGGNFGRNDRNFNQNNFDGFGGGNDNGFGGPRSSLSGPEDSFSGVRNSFGGPGNSFSGPGNGFSGPGNHTNRPIGRYVPSFRGPPKGSDEMVSYPRYNPSRYNNQGY